MNDMNMIGSSGVYATEYAHHRITVKLFESPELTDKNARGIFQAIVTYVCLESGAKRQELDTLEPSHVDHCRKRAIELEESANLKPFSKLFKSYMAQAYWSLIK